MFKRIMNKLFGKKVPKKGTPEGVLQGATRVHEVKRSVIPNHDPLRAYGNFERDCFKAELALQGRATSDVTPSDSGNSSSYSDSSSSSSSSDYSSSCSSDSGSSCSSD